MLPMMDAVVVWALREGLGSLKGALGPSTLRCDIPGLCSVRLRRGQLLWPRRRDPRHRSHLPREIRGLLKSGRLRRIEGVASLATWVGHRAIGS